MRLVAPVRVKPDGGTTPTVGVMEGRIMGDEPEGNIPDVMVLSLEQLATAEIISFD